MKRFFAALAAQFSFCCLAGQYLVYPEPQLVFEIGAGPGLMNSLTDLGGHGGIGKKFIGDLELKNFRAAFNCYALLEFKQRIAARLQLSLGGVQGADSNLRRVRAESFGRYERNLSFRSPVIEMQFALELHPLEFFSGDPMLSPYLAGGIGCFWFDPQARLGGHWYRLQPLRTEGQGFLEYPDRAPYSLRQLNFPLGMGLRMRQSDRFSFRFEIMHRFLRTDYLDDVSTEHISPVLFADYLTPGQALVASRLADRRGELQPHHLTAAGDQRGDPERNDSFFTMELKLGIRLDRRAQ